MKCNEIWTAHVYLVSEDNIQTANSPTVFQQGSLRCKKQEARKWSLCYRNIIFRFITWTRKRQCPLRNFLSLLCEASSLKALFYCFFITCVYRPLILKSKVFVPSILPSFNEWFVFLWMKFPVFNLHTRARDSEK